MPDFAEEVKELWKRNPIVVVAVVAGGAGLLFLASRKGNGQTAAPAVDNTPVTYQIYPGSGGVAGGGGGVPTPIPQPFPIPGLHHCLQGQHWDDATQSCVADPGGNACGGRECPPGYLCIMGHCIDPNPSPNPDPNPNPNPGCTYGSCSGGGGDALRCPDNMRCVNGCCQPPGPPEPIPGGVGTDPQKYQDFMPAITMAHALF